MSAAPLNGAPALSFGEVDAGGYHTLGWSAGATNSWGSNWYGQLGTGTAADSDVPFRVR